MRDDDSEQDIYKSRPTFGPDREGRKNRLQKSVADFDDSEEQAQNYRAEGESKLDKKSTYSKANRLNKSFINSDSFNLG